LDVVAEVPYDKKRKLCNLLSKGQAMMDFEGLKDMLIVLKVKHALKKHWIDFLSWGIIQSMNNLLL
jgi:hypothetical protein